MRRILLAALLAVSAAVFLIPAAQADEPLIITLSIKDNRFDQPRLEVPAGKKFVLLVRNLDGKAEEFESRSLKLEKIVPAGKEVKFNVGPLKAGEYSFFGEYHEKTAQGVMVAK